MSSSKLPEAAATSGGSSGGASEVTPTTAAARSLLDHPIEHSMLKVPAAYLNTVFRSYTHSVERELSQALETVAKLAEPSHDGSNATTLSGHEVYQSVEHLVGRLKGLKRKLDETNVTEKKQLQRVKTRLECLQKASASSSPDSGSPAGEDTTFWEQVRLNRALTDHLLRAGHLHAALQLAKDSGVEAFLDQEIFQRAQQVRTALSQKDCGPCLSWCAENRNRLRKLQSTLELNLRMQEFIELARVGSFVEAISYARKHFVSAMKDPDAQPKLQRVFTAIAFQRNTQCPPYKVLFDERRWTDLQTEFQQDLCRLYSLPSHSLLEITMQAGLSF
ncbi:CLTH domain-containing protein, partial [Balamuthia mandrillaris]